MEEVCGNCVHCIASSGFATCRCYHFQRRRTYGEVFDYKAASKARACKHYIEHTPFYAGELREIRDWLQI